MGPGPGADSPPGATRGGELQWPHSARSAGRPGRGRCDVDRYQYLLLMAGCLLLTLPLEFVFQARVYRRPRALLLALLPVVLVFSVWDIVGIARDHWTYNPAYVTGAQLILRMPLEELVFFVVIPICGLLTYEAVGQGLRRFGAGRRVRLRSGAADA